MPPHRPRRSVLYLPGSNARALEKARTLPVDAVILDLEDAVAPAMKEQARAQVAAAVRAGGFGHREVLVRVNGLSTAWGLEDLQALATAGADGILLPKVEQARTVHEAALALRSARAPNTLPVWCMIETPRGALRAEEIAGSSPSVAGLVMGTSDMAKDLRCAHTPDRQPLLTALGLTLLAGRAFGLVVLDGVHLDLGDEAGFVRACEQGRALGFDGKTLIHPSQIDAANRTFSPTADELAFARRVVAAHEDAVAAGRGVVLVDGRLVESLHVTTALQTLAVAEAVAALPP
jgi:citrate lyase subunit beta/citryl-CoA lyase